MNIEKLTIGEAREIAALLNSQSQPVNNDEHWVIGGKYFIRTVTHHLTGILKTVTPQELVLKSAAWIADDGRFSQALRESNFNEVEMFPSDQLVIVGRGSLVDAVQIATLPTSTK